MKKKLLGFLSVLGILSSFTGCGAADSVCGLLPDGGKGDADALTTSAQVCTDRTSLAAMKPDRLDRVGTAGETTILQGGTCRFGKDPATSVLDADCRAHAVKNLYVVDGSFLPTSGGVPLTLTIAANSFRVAARMIERLKKG